MTRTCRTATVAGFPGYFELYRCESIEQAGMYVFRRFTAFENEVRPGDEISNQG